MPQQADSDERQSTITPPAWHVQVADCRWAALLQQPQSIPCQLQNASARVGAAAILPGRHLDTSPRLDDLWQPGIGHGAALVMPPQQPRLDADLFEYGIHTEGSDVRAHVSVLNKTIYVFPTRNGVELSPPSPAKHGSRDRKASTHPRRQAGLCRPMTSPISAGSGSSHAAEVLSLSPAEPREVQS